MSSSSSSSDLNIAIIGGGLIGPRHAQAVTNNPSTHLLTLVDPAPHGPQTASSLNTLHFSSISDLLSSTSPRPDGAIICTPNSTHVPIALELIGHGIPVLVEKPISTSIESGLELIAAAEKKGVKVLVGHHRRFNPYLLSAKSCLSSSTLGRIIAVQGTWCLKKTDSYFEGPGEWRKSAKDGGVVMINLIHEIDLLQYLLGPIVYVSALPTTKTRDFDAEEGAAILLRFKSGVVGTFVLSDAVPSPWNFETGTGENPLIAQVPPSSAAGGFYRILGTEGSLSVPDLTIWKGDWWSGMTQTQLEVDKNAIPFDKQISHFVGVIRGDVEPRCNAEEALRAMVVCQAVKVSMSTGKAMEIVGFEFRPLS
ncbi:related to quinate utilisation oxidoreductase QutH [Phialocephala subalpina]|uniref:Related to quinate utilisation oxidoreductase QutH n=1 Tax=Phialocephala subalpina TaxID=576137 RepID=A0A1L7X1G2_9HELO|nr:related to quinate utilisation oxidoreductase QutH [Phialocephala subalpina]